jgi:hypothetical protein
MIHPKQEITGNKKVAVFLAFFFPRQIPLLTLVLWCQAKMPHSQQALVPRKINNLPMASKSRSLPAIIEHENS